MRTTTRVSAVLAAMLSLGAMPAVAQSANITATANVYQAITVTGARTLDFGNVFPGRRHLQLRFRQGHSVQLRSHAEQRPDAPGQSRLGGLSQ